jgi:Glyoxalase/Bleomycin resistance protein/Dioxygenase superfamily
MDMGWVITFVSKSNATAQVTVMRGGESADIYPQMTVEVDDVDRAHAIAVKRNLKIVYPLSDEPWGVRRFFVADPNGVVINIMSHVKSPKRPKPRQPMTRVRHKTLRKRSPRAVHQGRPRGVGY